MLDTARVLPTSMITGDSDILERSRHSEPYLTKSEVRLRSLKIARRLDKQASDASQRARNAPDPGYTANRDARAPVTTVESVD